ncbi:MAG TPA: helix-turn-helix domain-containing protein [Croceibacterium sp.]|nr:helix-turn-helix domain-containing protein [Croceibacterium sp.]
MKRINPRLAKLHRSYTTRELADLLDVHKNTVTGWLKAGLPRIDGTRPVLIHGDDFQVWWSSKRKSAKRPCQPGKLYCFKCREPKSPAMGMVEYAAANAITGNLKALCERCGTMMHRRTRLADIAAKMPGLEVRCTQASPSIAGRAQPSLNCDNLAGA